MNEIKIKEREGLIPEKYLEKNIINVINDFLLIKKNPNTKRRYRKVLEGFFITNNINILKDLSFIHISDLRKQIDKYGDIQTNINNDTGEILNPATINNMMYIIRSFFEYLINLYDYKKNPLIPYKKLPTKENSTTESLKKEEVIKILFYSKEKYKNIKSPIRKIGQLRNYLILSFLSLSLRRSEACNLEWSNLDIEKEYISVLQKGGGYKIIPIPTGLLDYIGIYKRLLESNKLKTKYLFSPFINNINGNKNKPISPDFIVQLIKTICIELEIKKHPDDKYIKNITPHSFRKTFIELSLDNKENYTNIMNATGHKTIELIRYYDNRDKLKNNSINTVSDWF